MLFSDFATTGGVLGVALVDAIHPVLGPDLPQPPQPRLAMSQLADVINIGAPDFPQPKPPSANIMIPDAPQPTPTPPPNKLTAWPFTTIPSLAGPDFPQPPPKLTASPVNLALESSSPDFPQPPPK